MSVTATKPLDVRATSSSGVLAWLGEGTPAARRSLLAASLGWMLDGFDPMAAFRALRSLALTTPDVRYAGPADLTDVVRVVPADGRTFDEPVRPLAPTSLRYELWTHLPRATFACRSGTGPLPCRRPAWPPCCFSA